uniref:Uncharacterized protein n=1 Tax=Toxoplasma gondii COUG TaxID=1074873 RepID=A0A2G8Y5U0_TOXGO|nr:hypothetical protein TGCOUG_392610 [Toxoplasma gondii COUG]
MHCNAATETRKEKWRKENEKKKRTEKKGKKERVTATQAGTGRRWSRERRERKEQQTPEKEARERTSAPGELGDCRQGEERTKKLETLRRERRSAKAAARTSGCTYTPSSSHVVESGRSGSARTGEKPAGRREEETRSAEKAEKNASSLGHL